MDGNTLNDVERNIQRLNTQIVWLDMASLDAMDAGKPEIAGIISWASAHLTDQLMDGLAALASTQADQR